MKKNKKHLLLFACCIPVKGFSRSVIVDTQRNFYHTIPNDLFNMLKRFNKKSIESIYNHYGKENEKTVDEYLAFLFKHEFAAEIEKGETAFFPDIDLNWDAYSTITNAIIDTGRESDHDYASLFRQLDELNCTALQLRFFHPCGPEKLNHLLDLLSEGLITSVDIIHPWQPAFGIALARKLFHTHRRLCSLTLFSAPRNKAYPVYPNSGQKIYTTISPVANASHCGIIHPDYFSLNINTFTEAQQFNTCLNRKIGIDEQGEIKNCPTMNRSFGHHKSTRLKTAIGKKGFTDTWKISKDQVGVCRDCEFRYICTDCRAQLSNPADLFSKPAKCSYNPYTATWQ